MNVFPGERPVKLIQFLSNIIGEFPLVVEFITGWTISKVVSKVSEPSCFLIVQGPPNARMIIEATFLNFFICPFKRKLLSQNSGEIPRHKVHTDIPWRIQNTLGHIIVQGV
jgi:hypothetical protein